MDKEYCHQCQIEEYSYYCACSQMNICEDCRHFHQGLTCFITSLDLDLTNPIINPNSSSLLNNSSIEVQNSSGLGIFGNSTLISYIDELIDQVKIYKEEYIKFLEKNPEIDKTIMKCPDLIQFNLNYEEKEIQKILSNNSMETFTAQSDNSQYFYTLYDYMADTILIKVNIKTFMSEETIKVRDGSFTCSWIIHAKNSVYLIGIFEGITKVANAYKIDLITKSKKKINIYDKNLGRFSCVLYNNCIYFIGGRITHKAKQIIQKKIFVVDTETDLIVNQFELDEPRYNTCAVIHKNKLYVTSENSIKSIEIFDLTSSSPKPEVKKIDLVAGLSYKITSYDNWIYFFNNGTIGKFDDELLQVQILQSKMKISESSYDLNMEPICYKNKIYFIGKDKAIIYKVENNEFIEKGIKEKNSFLG